MLVGLMGAFSLLLGAAGVKKVVAPSAAGRALLLTGLPGARILSSSVFIRVFGGAEIAVFLTAVFVGGRPSAASLGLVYLLLLVVAWRLVRVAPGRDCGCFGASSEPASGWHVGVNAAACLVAAAAMIWVPESLVDATVHSGPLGFVLLVGMVLLAWLGYLLMTALPTLLALDAKVVTTR